MRKSLLLLFIALALPAGIAADAALPADRVLDKPVTLSVKGEALCDIFPILREQTGARFQVGRDIADQKATIFVDDKPLRQVMEGLSTLFGYHWTKKTFSTGDIYELWQEDSARRRLADEYSKAWEAAWNAANADIELKAKLAAMSKKEREAFRRQLLESSRADSPQVKLQLEAINAADDPLLGPSARLFGEIPADARKMLQPGVEIKYNTLSPESEWVVPEDIARGLVDAVFKSNEARALVSSGDIASMSVTFTCPSSDRTIDILVAVSPTLKTAERSHTTWAMGTALTHQRVLEYLPNASTSLPRTSDVSGLERRVSIAVEYIVQERSGGPASSSAANRSDILAILHRKLGLQIISDHYSQWTTAKMPGTVTALEIAKDLDSPASTLLGGEQHATWGWDGELFYMRAKDIWHSDAMEIPNRFIRQWAASYRDRGHLDLYEQAAIAALSFEQFARLQTYREYLGLRKDAGTGNTAGLRLLGLMSEKQQKEALAAGTRVDQFTPEQHEALAAVLPHSFAMPTIGSDGILTMPVGVWTSGPPPNYRLDKPEAEGLGSTPVSVSLREGTASNPGLSAVVVGGSFQSEPSGSVSNQAVITMGPGAAAPGGIDYTMVISFSEGTPMEIGITISGGEPDKPSTDQPDK